MANSKISALSAATTPLAGTEIVPIVQSGSTKKVAVSDLTANRAVSVASLTVSTGDVIIGTSGSGVDFSADGHTSGMTSELLDDYEEGTWTPVLTSSNNDVTVTYSEQNGTYTKIGRLMVITAFITLASKSGGTGNTRIGGIPINPVNSSSGTIGFASNYTTAKPDQILIFSGGSIVPYYSNTAVNSAQLPISHVGSTSALYFTASCII